MTFRGRLGALACGFAIIAVAAAGPAAARGRTHTDSSKDVWTRVPSDSTSTWERSDRRKNVAVRSIEARHRARSLSVTVEMKNLVTNDDLFYLWVPLELRSGKTFAVFITAKPGQRKGRTTLQEGIGGSGSVDCPHLRGSISYRNDRFFLRVPRACLGRPRVLRLGGSVLNYPSGEYSGPVFVDTLYNDAYPTSWSRWLRSG